MSKEPKIKPIVIVGAGGMGRDTQWLIERINEEEPTYEILGYIDDGGNAEGSKDGWKSTADQDGGTNLMDDNEVYAGKRVA